MTAKHIAKMHAAKRKAEAQRRQAQIKAKNDFATAITAEHLAYDALTRARDIYGSGSAEAMQAQDDWYEACRRVPTLKQLPSDSLWRELEGR